MGSVSRVQSLQVIFLPIAALRPTSRVYPGVAWLPGEVGVYVDGGGGGGGTGQEARHDRDVVSHLCAHSAGSSFKVDKQTWPQKTLDLCGGPRITAIV